jgi:ParB/RepB/Spo0J family partition protein
MQLLTESIRASGVIQPLLARDHPDPEARLATPYMLIVGERRWTAARRAGLAAVPVLLHAAPLAPLDRLMMQIAENDGELHEELPLFDLAAAVARAFRLAGASQTQFARRYRRSRAWLSFLLRLAAAEGVASEALREGHLRGILAASTFLRLTVFQQRRLIAEARRSGEPITLRRAEKAAEQTDLRRRQRQLAAQSGIRQSQAAARGPGSPGSPTAAASAAAHSPTSSAAPAATPPAGAAPALCHRCRAAMGEPSERRPAFDSGRAAERGKRLQLLPAPPPPVALRRPRVDGPWITLEITGQQLETLVVLLGKKPAPTARAQVEQLLACL